VGTTDRKTLDVSEVAALLGVHPNSVRRAVARGKIPTIDAGLKRVLFSREAIERLIAGSDDASRRLPHENLAA
jgi:excisionase family DNA binding protein